MTDIVNDIVFRLRGLVVARQEKGQTMAEYAVVLAVITIAVVAVFTTMGNTISSAITRVTNDI